MLTKMESKEVRKVMFQTALQIKATNPRSIEPIITTAWDQLRPQVRNKMVYKAFHDTMYSFI